jgi:hypothetical protein
VSGSLTSSRVLRAQLEFLVKWVGYKLDRNSHWEPMSSFDHGTDPALLGCDQGTELDEAYPLGRFMREKG